MLSDLGGKFWPVSSKRGDVHYGEAWKGEGDELDVIIRLCFQGVSDPRVATKNELGRDVSRLHKACT